MPRQGFSDGPATALMTGRLFFYFHRTCECCHAQASNTSGDLLLLPCPEDFYFLVPRCPWWKPIIFIIFFWDSYKVFLRYQAKQKLTFARIPNSQHIQCMSRTYGVSIFIDYWTAPRDTEKDERKGKRHSTDKREWGQQLFSPRLLRALQARARRVVLIKPPPPPSPTHALPTSGN